MLRSNGEARERVEFGSGLRGRLERVGALSRDRTKLGLEQIAVPPSLRLADATLLLAPAGHRTDDDVFELLFDLTRKVDGREQLDTSHSRAIAALARDVARAVGLDDKGVQRAYLAGMFHDLGKLELPENLLQKPGPLNAREWTQMTSHAKRGADLVDRLGGMRDVADIVVSHHERWDGVGYPNRIAGESIPMEARIVAACDTFVTMTSDRPFRNAMPVAVALKELIRCAGTSLDPTVVGALLELTFEKSAETEPAARPALYAVA